MALNITKIKPLFNNVITTMDRFEEDVVENGIVRLAKGTLKPYQTVVSAGEFVKGITEGDKVMVNLKRFSKVRQPEENMSLKEDMGMGSSVVIQPDIVEINGIPHLFIQDRDIDFVFEGEEVTETKEESPLWTPKLKK